MNAVANEAERMRRHLKRRDELQDQITTIIEKGDLTRLKPIQEARDMEDAHLLACCRAMVACFTVTP